MSQKIWTIMGFPCFLSVGLMHCLCTMKRWRIHVSLHKTLFLLFCPDRYFLKSDWIGTLDFIFFWRGKPFRAQRYTEITHFILHETTAVVTEGFNFQMLHISTCITLFCSKVLSSWSSSWRPRQNIPQNLKLGQMSILRHLNSSLRNCLRKRKKDYFIRFIVGIIPFFVVLTWKISVKHLNFFAWKIS